MTLHCGRCGGELNGWAICQPCRVVDAINKDPIQKDIAWCSNPKPTFGGNFTLFMIFLVCVVGPLAMIFWYFSLFSS